MLGLGRADYLAEVQRQGLADAAGVAQPQTQAQRLGYELALREREELEGARRGLAAAWGEVEGGEGARLVTCDVRREAGFDAAAPKRISAAEGAAALLEWRGGGTPRPSTPCSWRARTRARRPRPPAAPPSTSPRTST